LSTNYHSVEIKANLEPSRAPKQFDAAIMAVLKAEIEILMNKDLAYQTTSAIIPEIVAPYTTPPFSLGEFVNQNTEFVVAEIARRLNLARKTVADCLQDISAFIQETDSHDFMDFTGQFHNNPARAFLPKEEPKKETKKRGRKPKPRKDEKPVKRNGRSYKSIADAAKEDKERSYAALRQKLWRDGRKAQNGI
jgi:hypothetical protein